MAYKSRQLRHTVEKNDTTPIITNDTLISFRCTPAIYNVAKELVNSNRVVYVLINSTRYSYTVSAYVYQSLTSNTLCKVELEWRKEGGYYGYFDVIACSHDGNQYRYLCIHEAAVLYWIYKYRINEVPYKHSINVKVNWEKEFITGKIQESRTNFFNTIAPLGGGIDLDQGRPLSLDIKFEDDSYRFKVGFSRLTFISNLKEFVDAVEYGRQTKIGKKLTYVNKQQFIGINQIIYELIKTIVYHRPSAIFAENKVYLEDTVDVLWNALKGSDYSDLLPVIEKDKLDLYIITIDDYSYRLRLTDVNRDGRLFIFDEYICIYDYENYYLYKCNETTKTIVRKLNSREESPLFPINTMHQDLQQLMVMCNNEIQIVGKETTYQRNIDITVYLDINEIGEVEVKEDLVIDGIVHNDGFNQPIYSHSQQLIKETFQQLSQSYDSESATFILNLNKSGVSDLVNHGVGLIRRYAQVMVSEDLHRFTQKKSYSISVGIRVENNLLDLSFSSEDIDPSEWKKILSSYKRKKKFYKLKNGEMIDLEGNESFEQVSSLLDQLNVDANSISSDGNIEVNNYRLASIEHTFKGADTIYVDRDESYKEALENFVSLDDYKIDIPDKYTSLFRDYQIKGHTWLRYMMDSGFHPILADDMGLGKTLQVLSVLEVRKHDGVSLVIAPATLVYNWKSEIEKFNVDLKCACVVGPKENRIELYNDYQHYDLLITSYDYIRRDIDDIKDIDFNIVILDEAQYIKNSATKNAQSVKEIKAKHRLALTGTPIENTLAELWSIFDFLMPGYLYNYRYFRTYFERPIIMHDEIAQQRLQAMVAPFILRRVKKDVLTELPDKIEKIERIDLNEKERAIYDAQLHLANQQLHSLSMEDAQDRMKVLGLLLRLRQLCCDLKLLYEDIDFNSSKSEAAFDIIENVASNHGKVLLFSSFTTMLDILAKMAQAKGIKYHMLTGKDSKEYRQETVKLFKEDDSTLFLISLKAGGTGLNLTEANTVIHYDPWWNQSATNQATDRAYRIGQENNVFVVKLVMHDTIEEKIIEMQEKKQALSDAFVKSNAGALSQMSKDEIYDLFSD